MNWHKRLPQLLNFTIPRFVTWKLNIEYTMLELYLFADARLKAYISKFFMAKSRAAPIKEKSMC